MSGIIGEKRTAHNGKTLNQNWPINETDDRISRQGH